MTRLQPQRASMKSAPVPGQGPVNVTSHKAATAPSVAKQPRTAKAC